MEHIEEAGIHSGDSACSLPPQNLSDDILAELRRQTTALAHALGVVGLMNIQFAIKAATSICLRSIHAVAVQFPLLPKPPAYRLLKSPPA
jgi:carbamoyl-phosphate synthase large subunit